MLSVTVPSSKRTRRMVEDDMGSAEEADDDDSRNAAAPMANRATIDALPLLREDPSLASISTCGHCCPLIEEQVDVLRNTPING